MQDSDDDSTGGGTTDDWSDGANWVDNSAPPLVAGNVGYRFGAATSAQLVSDMQDSYQFGQLQFNNLSGFSRNASYEHLLVAPERLRRDADSWLAANIDRYLQGIKGVR